MLHLIRKFGLKAIFFSIIENEKGAVYFEYKENAYVLYKTTKSVYCIVQNNHNLLRGSL